MVNLGLSIQTSLCVLNIPIKEPNIMDAAGKKICLVIFWQVINFSITAKNWSVFYKKSSLIAGIGNMLNMYQVTGLNQQGWIL